METPIDHVRPTFMRGTQLFAVLKEIFLISTKNSVPAISNSNKSGTSGAYVRSKLLENLIGHYNVAI